MPEKGGHDIGASRHWIDFRKPEVPWKIKKVSRKWMKSFTRVSYHWRRQDQRVFATTISRFLDIDVWSAAGSVKPRQSFQKKHNRRAAWRFSTHNLPEPRPPMIEFACKKNLEVPNGFLGACQDNPRLTERSQTVLSWNFPKFCPFFCGCGICGSRANEYC